MIPHQNTRTDRYSPSRTAAVFAGDLQTVDPRQAAAFGYREDVAIDRHAYHAVIVRPDDAEHVDYNARTVDVLWHGRVALDGHPWPLRVPFTVWPADRPVNLYAERGAGDTGERTVTVTLAPGLPFTVTGTDQQLPALTYYIGHHPVPVVTVSVLHVLLAALLDTEQLAAFHVEDTPDNPVHITTPDNRTATLRSLPDGSYPIGLLTEFCHTDAISGPH